MKVLWTSLWQPFSFAALSRSLAHVLLGYAFLSIKRTAFPFSFFVHPSYFFNSSHFFPLTTLYPLSSATWCPFFPQSSHVKYETTTSPLLYPSSNKFTSSGTPFPQYLNALCYRTFPKLLLHSSCCTFCGITICAVLSLSNLLFGQSLHWCPTPSHSKYLISSSCIFLPMEHASSFFGCTFCGTTTWPTLSPLSFSLFGHSFYWCPSSLYLKHCIAFSSFLSLFCLLISTPHLITLLDSTSNLFWGIDVLPSSSLLFL